MKFVLCIVLGCLLFPGIVSSCSSDPISTYNSDSNTKSSVVTASVEEDTPTLSNLDIIGIAKEHSVQSPTDKYEVLAGKYANIGSNTGWSAKYDGNGKWGVEFRLRNNDGSLMTFKWTVVENELKAIFNGAYLSDVPSASTTTVVSNENADQSNQDEPDNSEYENGYKEGYEKGIAEGHGEGYTQGMDDGYAEGYEKGYQDGYDESTLLFQPKEELVEVLSYKLTRDSIGWVEVAGELQNKSNKTLYVTLTCALLDRQGEIIDTGSTFDISNKKIEPQQKAFFTFSSFYTQPNAVDARFIVDWKESYY